MIRYGCAVTPLLASLSMTCYSQALAPGRMPRIASVDDRFQSYNVEMVEVTGGRFWKPYKDAPRAASKSQPSSGAPAGMNPDLFQYRPPIDLTNARLRKLAAALGPAYVRVSGTWANTTYFHDSDAPAPDTPPRGFNGVLTRPEWKGVVDFAHSVNAGIVTSFATSGGTRDEAGVWTPTQAQRLLAYTESVGGRISAAEFMNEPNIAGIGGAPKGYDAAAYARDVTVFRAFIRKAAPGMVFLGPGSVGEGGPARAPSMPGLISSEALLKATGSVFDAFSYHLYPAVSKRCAGMASAMQVTAADALSPEFLSRADKMNEFYSALRDRFDPGKPLWITETADAACGGNPWGSTFLDVFRYLDEHGRLARRGVQVIMHNTLASSDYGLLDENTFKPRPDYWAALLWRKLMGTTVLDPGAPPAANVYLYAHCLREHRGGVALLAINADTSTSSEIQLPTAAMRYTLSSPQLEGDDVQLNGTTLKLGVHDAFPPLEGDRIPAGRVILQPATVTFLAIPDARSASCR